MRKSDRWKTFTLPPLLVVSRAVAGADMPIAAAAREKLIAHVDARYFARGASLKQRELVQCREILSLACALRKSLRDQRRQQWLDKIREGLIGKDMTAQHLERIIGGLGGLGDKERDVFLAEWMDSSDSWHSWSPASLTWAIKRRTRHGNPLDKDALREEAISRALPLYVKDKASIRAMAFDEWRRFLQAMSLAMAGRHEQAIRCLVEMGEWPGADEDHVKALFLIGWVHLKANSPAEARATFEKVMAAYPYAAHSIKARGLVAKLKGV